MSGVKERLESVERAMQALTIRKSLLLERAMRSESPSDILKAAEIFNQQSKPANEGISDRPSGVQLVFRI